MTVLKSTLTVPEDPCAWKVNPWSSIQAIRHASTLAVLLRLTSPVLACTDSVYRLKDVRSQDEIQDSLTLLFRANRDVL